jgi:hypothetical protein
MPYVLSPSGRVCCQVKTKDRMYRPPRKGVGTDQSGTEHYCSGAGDWQKPAILILMT